MNLFENLLNMHENNIRVKTESNKSIDDLIELAGGINYIDEIFHDVVNEYEGIEKNIDEVAEFTYDRIKGELSLNEWTNVLEYLYYNTSNLSESSRKLYDIRFSFRGNGCCAYNRLETQYGDYKNLAHISDDGVVKYYDNNLPDDVKNKIETYANKMKSEYEEKIKKDTELKRKNDEFLKNRFKSESLSKDTLLTNFNRHYNGFIPLVDLTNYFSLDQFGEFIQWCRKEADLDYDYEKRYSDWSEIYQEINNIWSSEDVESISVENVFNFFSTSDLEEFWNWVETEYDLIEEELDESTKLEEAGTNKSGYTLNFGAWRTGNGMSFASKNELVSFLRSNYIDLETVITYCENVTNDFKNSMHKVNNSFIKDKDAQKKFFDRGYVKIVDVKNNDLEESIQLKESTSRQNMIDELKDYNLDKEVLLDFVFSQLSDDIIKNIYNEFIEYMEFEPESIEEATSGIGGAYTTKAIDILPTGVKKVNENLYDEYLERVMDEKSNVELVNLLHEIRDNNELKSRDKKKLEDEIRTKVKSIKTEAITEFYGKEWSDEEIQKMINKTKENPGLEYVTDPNEVAHPLNYNGKNYWLIGEEKEIVFDGKDCVVMLTVDEDLNRYLTYFEYTLVDDGDGESGPQELRPEISSVPYKMVAV